MNQLGGHLPTPDDLRTIALLSHIFPCVLKQLICQKLGPLVMLYTHIYSINLVHQTDNQVITQLSYPGGPTVQFLLEKTMEVPKSWGHPLVLFMFAG